MTPDEIYAIADEAKAIEAQAKVVGNKPLARNARKLYLNAIRAGLAGYYAGGPGESVLTDYRTGRFVLISV